MKINKFNEKTDLIPDYIIDSFYNRIEKKLNIGHKVDDKSIQDEINRIILINGGNIPDKIITLLNNSK